MSKRSKPDSESLDGVSRPHKKRRIDDKLQSTSKKKSKHRYNDDSDNDKNSSSSDSDRYNVKSKNRKKKKGDDSNRKLPFDAKKISKSDYYEKNAELRTWIFENKRRYLDDLDTKKGKKLFKTFIKKWNKGKLADKYYKGISLQSLESEKRTRYQWGFTSKLSEAEKMQLAMARDTVDSQTNDSTVIDRISSAFSQKLEKKKERQNQRKERTKDIQFISESDAQLEREQNAKRLKYDRKRLRKHDKFVADELVPKKEGFAARVEKRQFKHRQNNDSGDEGASTMNAYGGGGNDYQSAMNRRRRREDRRTYDRREKYHSYQQREKDVMAQFQKMVDQNQPKL